jgi:Regulator of ribonuclease activity B
MMLGLSACGHAKYNMLQTNPKLTDDQNDRAVLSALRASGSDLTKPTDMVFYLYVPSRRDAQAAAAELHSKGFTSEVDNPLGRLADGSYEWRYSVIAHVDAVPSAETLRRYRALYKRLAKRFKGQYDGWEAAVAP